MTTEKLREVFARYALALGPRSMPNPTSPVGDAHLAWMCEHALTVLIPCGRFEKAMRWLGWVQCGLVASGRYTLSEVKGHSRQDDHDFIPEA